LYSLSEFQAKESSMTKLNYVGAFPYSAPFAEAARLTGVSKDWIRAAEKAGEVEVKRTSRKHRVVIMSTLIEAINKKPTGTLTPDFAENLIAARQQQVKKRTARAKRTLVAAE
jgi:hypothetical protein